MLARERRPFDAGVEIDRPIFRLDLRDDVAREPLHERPVEVPRNLQRDLHGNLSLRWQRDVQVRHAAVRRSAIESHRRIEILQRQFEGVRVVRRKRDRAREPGHQDLQPERGGELPDHLSNVRRREQGPLQGRRAGRRKCGQGRRVVHRRHEGAVKGCASRRR